MEELLKRRQVSRTMASVFSVVLFIFATVISIFAVPLSLSLSQFISCYILCQLILEPSQI